MRSGHCAQLLKIATKQRVSWRPTSLSKRFLRTLMIIVLNWRSRQREILPMG
jgi:hypothetical protein